MEIILKSKRLRFVNIVSERFNGQLKSFFTIQKKINSKEMMEIGAYINKLNIGLNSKKLLKTGGYNKHTNKKKLKKLTREKNSLILNYNEAEFEADLGIA